MATEDAFKSKSLSPQHLRTLLDRLDARDAAASALSSGRNRRVAARTSFRRTDIRLQITHPGGGTVDCVVPARDLSATGIALLYWGFLHAGTQLRISLPKLTGGDEHIAGSVAWCKHVVGPHHLIGIRFAERVLPRLFVAPDSLDGGDLAASGDVVDPRALRGRVMVIGDDELQRELLKHHLAPTQITPILVPDTASAVAALRRGDKVDLLFVDLNLDSDIGEQAIKTCRGAGYSGPIAVFTAESSTQRLREVQSQVSAILQKPYDQSRLLHLLSLWLTDASVAVDPAGDNAIRSVLASDPKMHEMISRFVLKARELAVRIQKSIDTGDLTMARQCCSTLKGTGGSFGFPIVSRAAGDAVLALDASQSVAESATVLQRLIMICRQLAGPRSTGQAAAA